MVARLRAKVPDVGLTGCSSNASKDSKPGKSLYAGPIVCFKHKQQQRAPANAVNLPGREPAHLGVLACGGSMFGQPFAASVSAVRLATALLAGVAGDRSITVNAPPASIAFWEAVGFNPDPRDGHTHILCRESV